LPKQPFKCFKAAAEIQTQMKSTRGHFFLPKRWLTTAFSGCAINADFVSDAHIPRMNKTVQTTADSGNLKEKQTKK